MSLGVARAFAFGASAVLFPPPVGAPCLGVSGVGISRHPPKLMPKYVIERDIPGAGKLTPDQLQGISQKSCSVLSGLGPSIQWIQSYVTGDKVYCVYIAPNEALVREHAQKGGFPANRISEVVGIIDPTTAEG